MTKLVIPTVLLVIGLIIGILLGTYTVAPITIPPVTETVTNTVTVTTTKIRTTTSISTMTLTTTITTTVISISKEIVPVTTTITKYVYIGGGHGGSVFGNVTVITPRGGRPIAEVKPGDLVLTEEGFKPVKEVKIIHVDNLYRITLEDGKVLLADDAQPVITTQGKKPVRELRVGDELLTLDGSAKITFIQKFDQEADVYDLIFEEPLNYYANKILVNDLKAGVLIPTIILYYPYSEFIFMAGG